MLDEIYKACLNIFLCVILLVGIPFVSALSYFLTTYFIAFGSKQVFAIITAYRHRLEIISIDDIDLDDILAEASAKKNLPFYKRLLWLFK